MPKPYDCLIRGGILVGAGASRPGDLAVSDGRIAVIARSGELEGVSAEQVIDATGLHVLPGLIDGHVHFRQPGLEHKEDWLTGSRAAVMGGVTTVLEMPNTQPPTASAEAVRDKARLASANSYCDLGIFGLLGANNEAQLEELLAEASVVGLKAFLGPTTGDLAPPADEALRAGLRVAARARRRVAFHAEDARIVAQAEAAVRAAGRNDSLAHLASRPVEAEAAAIERVGRLLSETGAAGHILHLSSVEGLAAVESWRARGAELSCEVSAHHCFLSADDYDRLGGLIKCYPPVREAEQCAALVAALAEGRIDCIGSDHAPHAPEEKSAADIWQVPAGIAGVETTLSLFLTHAVESGRMSLERLVQAFAERPARLWGLWPRKGSLEIGADADIVLVDLQREGVIHGAALHGKHGLTPFEGWPTRGAVVATILRGQLLSWAGELRGQPGLGRPVEWRATRSA